MTSTATPAGITQVREAVALARRYSKEAFVPLSHPPGHAQFDFGEATVVIAGEPSKAALAVITLPYSDTYFLSAYPEGVHRDLPGRPRAGLRVLRRGAASASATTTPPSPCPR